MRITKEQLHSYNQGKIQEHQEQFNFLRDQLEKKGINVEAVLKKIQDFQVAVPSWALGAGGTRFGRFSFGGEPSSLEEKINDVGIIHALTQAAGAISLHIPWDIPKNPSTIKELADSHGIIFDAVNSNTFQDQINQKHSYKFGSLSNTEAFVSTG